MDRKWFEKLLIKSIVFTLFLSVLFVFIKLLFVLYSGWYHGNLGKLNGFGEFLQTFFNGLRYDARPIAALSIVYFVLGLLFFWTQIRWFILWLYVLIVVTLAFFIGISEIVFYEIFDDVFNAHLLGLFFDDQKAIFHTGVSGQYGLSKYIFTWIILLFVFMYIYTKLFGKITREYGYDPLSSIRSRSTQKRNYFVPISLFAVFAFMMLVSINSAFSLKGVSLDQVIKPVENEFLRKISSGAIRDLTLVYRGYVRISNSSFDDYISQSPLEAVREYFDLEDMKSSYNLKELLAQKVNNHSEQKIEHIFYIVAESLSEWHFNEEFDELDLTSGLKSLLADSHGVKIGVFLENAGSTIKSMDVHLTGLFQTEIPINSMLGTLKPFITAPGVIMKDLGYRTNFYYGGSGIWQKLDQYALSQGFRDIYYSTQIIENAKLNGYSAPYDGLWGAYDHHLFNLVRDNIFKERTTPSFNMILTTSNHPPYDAPLEQFGVPLEQITQYFATHTQYKNKDPRLIGHIWYEDKMIAKFIREVSEILPNSLFVITGDHYDREYPSSAQILKAQNSIPLIVYSPVLDLKKNSNVGSHIDITPTIVQLTAPNGYVYHSFGTPLVGNEDIALGEKDCALGYFAVATNRFIYKDGHLEYFRNGLEQYGDKELAKKLYKKLQQATALSWWILTNGYEVKALEK